MIHQLLETLGHWMVTVQESMGLPGVVLLMAIESACIPLPSEVIMPFAGYLAYKGVYSLWAASLAGALGCVIGGWVAYFIGYYGGRPFVERYGKYVLLNIHDLDMAERWFAKYGEIIAFVSRLLPVVRTFIALPAGMAKMNFWKFTIYSFLGSLPFCYFLAWVGMKLGENWPSIKTYFHQADIVIGVLIAIGAYVWIKHHVMPLRKKR